MKERAISLWVWAREHRRFSIALALALVVASVGTAYIISQLPPPRGQECGQVNYPFPPLERDPAVRAASMQIFACFWHNYQHCQPATMSLFSHGVDTSSYATMTVERRSIGCDVYIGIDDNVDGRGSHRAFRCASMTEQGENLHLSQCDDKYAQSFDIQPITLNFGNCGTIGTANSTPSPAEAEQCIASAYALCAPALLYYTADGRTNEFTIQDHCAIAYSINGRNQGTCDSMAARQDGLHFFHCGNEGDIIVPATLPTPTPPPTPVETIPPHQADRQQMSRACV
jgi:hypothetical protein